MFALAKLITGGTIYVDGGYNIRGINLEAEASSRRTVPNPGPELEATAIWHGPVRQGAASALE